MRRCGACGKEFETGKLLAEHLKVCEIAADMVSVVDITIPVKERFNSLEAKEGEQKS